MVNPEYAQKLKEKASLLPYSPGVYIMKDKNGKIIYIGKSKKIKNRVSQYFNETDFKSYKTNIMTSHIADFEYILCDTEIEALSLENNLIKTHKPKYNIKLKDDKSYPYIAINLNEEYPRFFMTRDRSNITTTYFGPYTGISTVFDVIRAVNRAFSLPPCRYSFPKDKGKIKHCIYRQMGCISPCKLEVSSQMYKEQLKYALDFLNGNHDQLINSLNDKMLTASDNMQYELAASYRDQIASINHLYEKQKVVANPDIDKDIIGFYDDGNISCLSILYIRGGKLLDNEYTYFSYGEIIDSSILTDYICNLYDVRSSYVKEIEICDYFTSDDIDLLSEYLSKASNRKVYISSPKRGDKVKLVNLANENAKQKCTEYKRKKTNYEKAEIRLAQIAGLEVVPQRIEAFDISNLGNENIKAGLVVFQDGKPDKNAYRIFNIKSVEHEDDYASMRECVDRHLRNLSEGDGIMPDLILIDGGKGHISSVKDIFYSYGLPIAYLGMVKDDKHRTRALVSNDGEIDISLEKEVYSLIYSIQEEVHRYTVKNMMAKKRKTYKKSSLENIQGVGKVKAKLLLDHFTSISNLKEASVKEITDVKLIDENLAKTIYDYLHKEKK